jgi:hypothetical protein
VFRGRSQIAGEKALENRQVVDQKLVEVLELIKSWPSLFAHQGAVLESWRIHGGKKLGPYYRLAFRQQGRQRSIYLGASNERAGQVRARLAAVQKPAKSKQVLERARARVKVELRKHKRGLDQQLRERGLYLKGYEVRGWSKRNRLLAPPVEDLCLTEPQEGKAR